MTEIFNNNGYGYVDLGLPSGTKWATMNVGASKPSDFGPIFPMGRCTRIYQRTNWRRQGIQLA